jgi:rhodanese-related sulfurtransferase
MVMILKYFTGLSFLLFFIVTAGCQGNQSTSGQSDDATGINKLGDPRDLKPLEFRKKLDQTKDHVILDVRTETERLKRGFMLDARHIDFYRQDFNERIDNLDKGKVYFVYCHSGQRSGITVDRLRERGIMAYNLEGGFPAWREAFPF